jgi:hypothetical protein
MAFLSRPVYWRGTQWAVTGHGVEAIKSYYPIQGKRLWENDGDPFMEDHPGWLAHMREKTWIDIDDFRRAIEWAVANYEMLAAKHPRNWRTNKRK